jgi:hypothetical protein
MLVALVPCAGLETVRRNLALLFVWGAGIVGVDGQGQSPFAEDRMSPFFTIETSHG